MATVSDIILVVLRATEEEYLNRILNATIENHCAKTCDVLVSYLYGQPESKSRVNVKVVDADGEIIEPIQRSFAGQYLGLQ